jgi:hypothetical protein
MDQDKLSRLFADLRRESLATGSYPITVRHPESMIGVAEASAQMALREYMRLDDIDLAISVAVESFVNAQKTSIKRTLQRFSLEASAYDTQLWTGVQEVLDANKRLRRATGVPARPVGQGQNPFLPVAAIPPTGACHSQNVRTRRMGRCPSCQMYVLETINASSLGQKNTTFSTCQLSCGRNCLLLTDTRST